MSVDRFTALCLLALCSSFLMRLMKWRACGIMNATWFMRPTSVASVW